MDNYMYFVSVSIGNKSIYFLLLFLVDLRGIALIIIDGFEYFCTEILVVISIVLKLV